MSEHYDRMEDFEQEVRDDIQAELESTASEPEKQERYAQEAADDVLRAFPSGGTVRGLLELNNHITRLKFETRRRDPELRDKRLLTVLLDCQNIVLSELEKINTEYKQTVPAEVARKIEKGEA